MDPGPRPPNFYSLHGDICKTVLFDLSISDQDFIALHERDGRGERFDAVNLVDAEHLRSLGIERAARVAAILSKFTSLDDADIDSEYGATIASMSIPLQSFQDPRRIAASKEAYRRILRQNIEIPRSIVTAFEAETKIRGALKETKALRFEEGFLAGALVGNLLRAHGERRVSVIYSLSNDDLPSAYRCFWVSGSHITPSLAGRLIQDHDLVLAADAYKGSIAHVMLSYCGTRSGLRQHGDPFLHKLQRGFKDFVKGDVTLEAGLRIAREAPHLIPDFATAVGLSPQQQASLQAISHDQVLLKGLYHPTPDTNLYHSHKL